MFSNVDVFSKDKLLELSVKLKDTKVKPLIIAIQEVKPKNFRYEISLLEYMFEGYDIAKENLQEINGRGQIIYIKRGTTFKSVKLTTCFSEYCCIEVACSDANLLFTSIYRSPTSSNDNNMNLLQLMQEISDHKVQYKITVGDFNLPHINWNYCTSTMGQHDDIVHTLFLEKVRASSLSTSQTSQDLEETA